MKKRLFKNKITALLMAVTMAIPFGYIDSYATSNASGDNTEEVELVDGIVELESASEMAEILSNGEVASEQIQTERVVVTNTNLDSLYGAEDGYYLDEYNEYVLNYESIEAANEGYSQLVEDIGEENVFIDEVISTDNLFTTDEELEEESEYDYNWIASEIGFEKLSKDLEKYDVNKVINVAVIDTGVDISNKYIAKKIDIENSKYIYKNDDGKAVTDIDISDKNGHGTTITEIIARYSTKDTNIRMYKIFNDNGTSSSLALATALQMAVEDGNDVINMSLGYVNPKADSYNFLNSIINKAYENGQIFVEF